MILAISVRRLGVIVGFIMLTAALFCAVGLRVGFTEKENMNKKDFQISIDAQRLTFAASPILKNGKWFVPLEPLGVGKKEEAMAEWRKALALDPQNWIIHKQIWAVEYPDKFYDGGVDYGCRRYS